MLDIIAIIPGKKRKTSSGWWSFNAVCCHNRGHSADKRGRGGIIIPDDGTWRYHCFNCQFKCGFQLGKHFSSNLKSLLGWCGLDREEIEKLSFKSFSQRDGVEQYIKKQASTVVTFKDVDLPLDSRPLDPEIDVIHVEYLASRGITPADYPFYVVDDESRQRIIIPYYHGGRIVGNTSRFYDSRKPKYLSEQQNGYVFNIDGQHQDWQHCILVEGQFDAISIGGCGYLGSSISDEQAQLLKRLQRNIIVVPDQDAAGLSICDRALELGYQVSIPTWAPHIKDVNDAVVKYGKLPTLLSILENATTSKIIIEMKRKKLIR